MIMPKRSKPRLNQWSKRLGPSLQIVLDWMKEQDRPVTSAEVAEALHEAYSQAPRSKVIASVEKRAHHWATQKLLRLSKHGLVILNKKEKTWRVLNNG